MEKSNPNQPLQNTPVTYIEYTEDLFNLAFANSISKAKTNQPAPETESGQMCGFDGKCDLK